jgi:hypothetical protein
LALFLDLRFRFFDLPLKAVIGPLAGLRFVQNPLDIDKSDLDALRRRR